MDVFFAHVNFGHLDRKLAHESRLHWLKEFVDVTARRKRLASRLALSGTNIAGIEKRCARHRD